MIGHKKTYREILHSWSHIVQPSLRNIIQKSQPPLRIISDLKKKEQEREGDLLMYCNQYLLKSEALISVSLLQD